MVIFMGLPQSTATTDSHMRCPTSKHLLHDWGCLLTRQLSFVPNCISQ